MSLALNKTTLHEQQAQARIYRQFLPSLDLKRKQLLGALQREMRARDELAARRVELDVRVEQLYPLLGSSTVATRQLATLVRVEEVILAEENVLGTRLPVLATVQVVRAGYSKFIAPFWVDVLVCELQAAAELELQRQVADQRVARLQDAVRKITQRVNLFEKVLIPRAEANIRKIVLFLSDQECAAVVRSKIAKSKTLAESVGPRDEKGRAYGDR